MNSTYVEYSYAKSMANFETFCNAISSSIKFLFLKIYIYDIRIVTLGKADTDAMIKTIKIQTLIMFGRNDLLK